MTTSVKFLFENEFDAGVSVSGGASAKLLTGKEIEDLRDSAFAAGVSEGAASESKTTEHRQSEALAAIANRMGAIAQAQDGAMSRTIDEATTLTVAIARKLSPALAEFEPLAGMEAMIREFLHQLIEEPHIVVRVPEALIDPLKDRIDEVAASCGFAGRVVLIPDGAMTGNDCRLEWADGGVTRNIETILTDIETGLSRMLQNPAALSGDDPQQAPALPGNTP